MLTNHFITAESVLQEQRYLQNTTNTNIMAFFPTNGEGCGGFRVSIKVLSDEKLSAPEVEMQESIQIEIVSCTVSSSLCFIFKEITLPE